MEGLEELLSMVKVIRRVSGSAVARYTSVHRLFGVHWKVEAASRRLSNEKAAGRRFHYNIPKTSRGEV